MHFRQEYPLFDKMATIARICADQGKIPRKDHDHFHYKQSKKAIGQHAAVLADVEMQAPGTGDRQSIAFRDPLSRDLVSESGIRLGRLGGAPLQGITGMVDPE
ncbi:hypothetical protein [Rhodovulum bhavnagarense]|uniref:hypothetical protein n=1 Tax=Rhodovulum bhavnagarense TaxID=992286 RepID=UPI0010471FC6|nr:hypothetical protein [Rhodovulum bhavnagarense]